MTVRVRFAPSPTGYLHIGGARTALFNWLFARKQGGKFILRIEDTDQTRTVPGALQAIMDGLRWLGLDWDEGPDVGGPYGPYVQTERADLYREWAEWLLGHGHAYKCFCTPEELEAMRREQMEKKLPLGYDGRCRHLTPAQIAAHEDAGREPVIRFKMPESGETTIQDAIRGEITYDNKQIIDAVLLKSDGLPTYHLANVVDDHFMEISHIMRADEWINTAPLHIHLYQAFGWQIPVYAHLSLVMNPSGTGKLSKRTQAFDDDGQQVLVKVEEFQEAGYLPQAVVNFLANVGYATGDDREKYDVEEAIDQFKLEKINPAPSRLPYSKLDWLNGQYIQELSPEALAKAILPFLQKEGYEADVETLLPVTPAMRTRLKRLPEAVDFLRFIFERNPLVPDAEKLTHKKLPHEEAEAAFREARAFVANTDSYDLDTIGEEMMAIGERHTSNGKAGPFLGRMRYAVTRQRVSPPLFESMLALGREETLARLDEALALFEA